jgi:methylenetetrahydrofolate dehydrogenase (NADP+)/methenyltetrahydrofolate cyclohydrolase
VFCLFANKGTSTIAAMPAMMIAASHGSALRILDDSRVLPPQAQKAATVAARILDGKTVANELGAALRPRIVALRERGIHPTLAVVVVGADPASLSYIRALERAGERLGINVRVDQLDASANTHAIREHLARYEANSKIHGVMLQQPLPAHLDIRSIADAVPQYKDVDGAHPVNEGNLAFGNSTLFVPATPAAVMLLLERSPHWPLLGRYAVMVGRSAVVGAPVALLMLGEDASVTVLHKASRSLQPYVRMAEIVVTATGVPGLLRGEDIAPGATVIDVGTTPVDGKLLGDVDFESVSLVAGAITPVPGGVGPITSVALLRNVVVAAERSGVA